MFVARLMIMKLNGRSRIKLMGDFLNETAAPDAAAATVPSAFTSIAALWNSLKTFEDWLLIFKRSALDESKTVSIPKSHRKFLNLSQYWMVLMSLPDSISNFPTFNLPGYKKKLDGFHKESKCLALFTSSWGLL